jgi:hypothetical protein
MPEAPEMFRALFSLEGGRTINIRTNKEGPDIRPFFVLPGCPEHYTG